MPCLLVVCTPPASRPQGMRSARSLSVPVTARDGVPPSARFPIDTESPALLPRWHPVPSHLGTLHQTFPLKKITAWKIVFS